MPTLKPIYCAQTAGRPGAAECATRRPAVRKGTVLAGHDASHELEVTVKYRVLVFVHRAIWQRSRCVQAGRLANSDADVDAGMRNHFYVKCIGQASDLHEPADAGMPHLGLDNRHGEPFQARAHFVHGAPLVSQRQSDPDAGTHMHLAFDIFRLARCLDKIGGVGCEPVDQPNSSQIAMFTPAMASLF